MGGGRRSRRRGSSASGPAAERHREASGPVAGMLALQRQVGNAAVSRILTTEPARRLDRGPVIVEGKPVTEVEFTVGKEIDLKLATQASSLAADGVSDAELMKLRTVALADDTITDDERMFLAALLDAGNAAKVASAKPKAGTTWRFSRTSIQSHLAKVANLGRPSVDAAVTGAADADAADKAALAQIGKLIPSDWTKRANAAVAFGKAASVGPAAILKAMIAAASDSTPGDQVMAGTVYAIAAAASHAAAPDVQAGRVKVDEKPGASVTKTEFAKYFALGSGAFKGDTIYVPGKLDVSNIGHRALVIHELTHAMDDKGAPDKKLKPVTRDHEELRGYRGEARYALDQIAGLSGKERTRAVKQFAAATNLAILLALVLEAGGDDAQHALVAEIDAARPGGDRLGKDALKALRRRRPEDVEDAAIEAIRQMYGIENEGGAEIQGANEATLDSLSGESVLDWIDKASD